VESRQTRYVIEVPSLKFYQMFLVFFVIGIVKVWNGLPDAADDFATVRSFTRLIERVDLSEHLVY